MAGKGLGVSPSPLSLLFWATFLLGLYDHTSPEKETVNIAKKHPGIVGRLEKELAKKLKLKAKY